MIEDEIFRLINRVDALQTAIDSFNVDDTGTTRELIGVTTTVTTYPTSASSFFAVQLGTMTGTEVEGNVPTTTVASGAGKFYALNLGGSVPPVGTIVIIMQQDGLLCFRYD